MFVLLLLISIFGGMDIGGDVDVDAGGGMMKADEFGGDVPGIINIGKSKVRNAFF